MKIGIYIDASNINRNGGYGMRYDILRDYCHKEGGEIIHMNTYVAYNKEKADEDREYRDKLFGYYAVLRNFGYKVITKRIRWFSDEEGLRLGKAAADLEMATDLLVQAKKLDIVYVMTSDEDFTKVIQALQNTGIRVEIIGFKNVSPELISEADRYTSGYLIPNLLPVPDQKPNEWGAEDSRLRGMCYAVSTGFGFLRFFDTDESQAEVFFHFSELNSGRPPELEDVYEFRLANTEKGWQAKELVLLK